jgi:transposase
MPEALVSEGLWEVIGPLLPAESPKPKGGRPRVPDRAALEGIVYVLRSGIPWRMLPGEFGCSGVTCWRRLRDWQEAGVWRRLRQALLDRLGQAGLIDWSRASVDSASTPAKKGGRRPVPARWTAADPARNATCSSTGTPLVAVLTGARSTTQRSSRSWSTASSQ